MSLEGFIKTSLVIAMASMILEMITALFPLLIFIALYIGVWIWGRYRNKLLKDRYFDDVINALDPYIENYKRVDPNDRNTEIRMLMKDEFLVRNASAWLILLPRTSFPTMLVEWLFFHSKDSFGIAANFPEKPRILFEVIPYRIKSAIKKDFEYLVELDDITTKYEQINEKYLIKSNKPTVLGQLVRSNMFLDTLREYSKTLQWISVRTDEPHFEVKFELTGKTADFLELVKFSMAIMKFFGKVTEKTKNQPLPVILKKEPKKLSEKEKAKQREKMEKEREKKLREQEKQREKERKRKEKEAKKLQKMKKK